jgi:hypothetical protein
VPVRGRFGLFLFSRYRLISPSQHGPSGCQAGSSSTLSSAMISRTEQLSALGGRWTPSGDLGPAGIDYQLYGAGHHSRRNLLVLVRLREGTPRMSAPSSKNCLWRKDRTAELAERKDGKRLWKHFLRPPR